MSAFDPNGLLLHELSRTDKDEGRQTAIDQKRFLRQPSQSIPTSAVPKSGSANGSGKVERTAGPRPVLLPGGANASAPAEDTDSAERQTAATAPTNFSLATFSLILWLPAFREALNVTSPT